MFYSEFSHASSRTAVFSFLGWLVFIKKKQFGGKLIGPKEYWRSKSRSSGR